MEVSGVNKRKEVVKSDSIGRPPTLKELEELFTTNDYPLKNSANDDKK